VPGIDVIIGGHKGPVVREPYRVEKTLVVQSGERGEEVGVLILVLNRDKQITAWHGSHIELTRGIPEDTAMLQVIDGIKAQ
jgi:2',3'-cyclic-nucleotide 2'-phosphodiesterase (5'-nucleotidase family)